MLSLILSSQVGNYDLYMIFSVCRYGYTVTVYVIVIWYKIE